MYPNFPQQVADASDAELFINAVIHYISMGSWTPEYEKAPRLSLPGDNKTIFLSVALSQRCSNTSPGKKFFWVNANTRRELT